MPRPYILQPKDLSRPAGRQAKSRIFFRLCKNSLISNFWNLTFATVAFSAEFRSRPAGIRRRNFFSGGRRKNAVFSPREKSEFPLQECSVNLHYKIGGQIWSGNPAENRPPPRPPRRTARPTIASKIRLFSHMPPGISRPTAEDRVRGRISNFRGVSHGPPDRSFGKVPVRGQFETSQLREYFSLSA